MQAHELRRFPRRPGRRRQRDPRRHVRRKVPLRGPGLLELRRARLRQRLLLRAALLLELLRRRRARAAPAPVGGGGAGEPRPAEAARDGRGGGGGGGAAERARGPLARQDVLEPLFLLAQLRGARGRAGSGASQGLLHVAQRGLKHPEPLVGPGAPGQRGEVPRVGLQGRVALGARLLELGRQEHEASRAGDAEVGDLGGGRGGGGLDGGVVGGEGLGVLTEGFWKRKRGREGKR